MVGIAALDILPPEKEIVETVAYGVWMGRAIAHADVEWKDQSLDCPAYSRTVMSFLLMVGASDTTH